MQHMIREFVEIVLEANKRDVQHFNYDETLVSRLERRDPEIEKEQVERLGSYSYREFKLVPIENIIHKDVWKPSRLASIEKAIDTGKKLPPIDLSPSRYSPGKYEINDGIHRYNASIDAGYSTVPAMITHWVDVESSGANDKEKQEPTLAAKDWVKLKEPIEGFKLAMVLKPIGSKLYSLLGADKDGADWIGDIHVSLFTPIEAESIPSGIIKNAHGHWMNKTV